MTAALKLFIIKYIVDLFSATLHFMFHHIQNAPKQDFISLFFQGSTLHQSRFCSSCLIHPTHKDTLAVIDHT